MSFMLLWMMGDLCVSIRLGMTCFLAPILTRWGMSGLLKHVCLLWPYTVIKPSLHPAYLTRTRVALAV